ncbi:hypothetical protein Tco_0246357 [Tanacetum coccineum]
MRMRSVGMSWEDFKTLTIEEFYPSNEMQKLETELWNHAMVGAGHAAYTERFHELASWDIVRGSQDIVRKVRGKSILNIGSRMVGRRHHSVNNPVGINKARDTVMSDSEDFMVTYTAVSSPFRGLSDIGSPGVDGPPAMPDDLYAYMVAALQALPSLDYVSGLEYPPSPDFVPEPVYPEFMPLEDEVLPAKEQPLPVAALPTADAPGYVPGLDPKEDLEEDDDEDPKEDPANYPVDRGDDGDVRWSSAGMTRMMLILRRMRRRGKGT